MTPPPFPTPDAAHAWLLSLISDPAGLRHITPRPPAEKRARMLAQLPRLQVFLDSAGNPERTFRSVHVAGTSGKGSVTQLLAALLTAAGQRTVDHISPWLQTPREKLRLDGQMIAPPAFIAAVEELREKLTAHQAQGGLLSYGEAWVALTLLWTAAQRPDYAVIETGMGGRYDPTNVLPSRLAIVTNIGYDHTESLGHTLPEIAWHKAGIIKPGSTVLTGADQPEVLAVIAAEAAAQKAKLIVADEVELDGESADLLATLHGFRRTNARLALLAARWLAQQDGFSLPHAVAADTISRFTMPGRLEPMQEAPLVVLDAAHNPAKMAALVEAVQGRWPERRWTVVAGFIYNKDAAGMIAPLRAIADRFVLTEPQVFGKPPAPAAELARLTGPLPTDMAPDVQSALDLALESADADSAILVTGSIYLVGAARNRWTGDPSGF